MSARRPCGGAATLDDGTATIKYRPGVLARVGAADDPRAGESTFLREMRETAAILKASTPRSFVVVDEIGRGTATTDGTALAHAVCSTLSGAGGPLSIFTTHFFELTALEDETNGRVKNFHVGGPSGNQSSRRRRQLSNAAKSVENGLRLTESDPAGRCRRRRKGARVVV